MSVCFLLSKEEVEGLLNSLSENDLEKYFGHEAYAKFVSFAKEKLKSMNEILSTLENAGEDLRELANKIEKGKIGSAYDNELRKEIAEELEVEAFNEDFMKNKSISEIPRADYLISLCVKEKIVFLFTLEILSENDKTLEPVLKEASELLREFVEEKDDFFTMLEIYLDPVERAEFEEALKEALNLMGKHEETSESIWTFFENG
jgi:cysteinyl-tRNA synthetase